MKRNVAALISGLLFGVGLVLSGMTNPSKVRAFLDVFGAWDASLAFVMLGAIGTHALFVQKILRRPRPLYDERFHLPAATRLDAALIAGAALFGVGWGLSGFCPGPALVSAAAATPTALVFVPAMVLGMWLSRSRLQTKSVERGSPSL